MSSVRLSLLGPPRLERDTELLELDTRKTMALVAYLAVAGPSPGGESPGGAHHTREALATLLWPESEPQRARSNLRRSLSVLRKALAGAWLVVDRETIGTDPNAGVWLDVDRFRHLLQTWEAHGHPQAEICPNCLDSLAEAVELYRGDFMAGFSLRDSVNFDEWQFFQTEGLRQEMASALERLVRGHSAQGAYESAIPYARRWLALDPLHEPVHRHLMQLYASAGQRHAALRQYQECMRILEEELGLAPAEETTALYEQIRTRPADREEPLFPAPAPRHNLPAQTTAFVGREKEVAEIKDRLKGLGCRLLTLLGPGGIGKTRLALKAAEELVSEAQPALFGDGVYLVSLASLDSVDAIVPAAAKALSFSFYDGRTLQQQLLDYLSNKRLLLILDNLEHLLVGADLVVDILKAAPQVKILATSREKLKVQGEHLFHVTGMQVPERDSPQDALDYSAVQLFAQSARRLRPDFVPQTDDLKCVARICRLVQGMPLGILLAAGWAEMLSPQEIADEISRSLDFLETDLRDVPERQRSLRAVFDHSWRLLSEREREVFQGVSVFRGGFTRKAAQQVTSASLRELLVLVNKSLLLHAASGRYEVHELLRQYAADKLRRAGRLRRADGDALSAWDIMRDRHSAYYTTLLGRLEADLKSDRQQAAVAEIDVEMENVRAAWEWATKQGHIEQLDRAMDSLALYWRWRSHHQEGQVAFRKTVERLSTAISESSSTSSKAFRVLARLLTWQSRLWGWVDGHAGRQLRQSQELLDRPEIADLDTRQEKAFLLQQMGWSAAEHDTDRAKELCRQSLALYQEQGDQYGMAETLDVLGRTGQRMGAYDEARKAYEEGLALRQVLGDRKGIARSLAWLSNIAQYQGRPEKAVHLARESVAICQEIGDQGGAAFGFLELGRTLLALGRFSEAHSALKESPAIRDNLGFSSASARLLLGTVQAQLGWYKEAREQGQTALTLASEQDYRLSIGRSCWVLGCVALAEKAYVEAQRSLAESVTAFREIGQQAEWGWALAGLGYAFRELGHPYQAWQCVRDALRASAGIGSREADVLHMMTLPAVTLLLADQGEVERAVELYTLASRYPRVANSRWFEDVAGQHIAAVAATLPPDVVAAAEERGLARNLEGTVSELLAELEEQTPTQPKGR